MNKTLAIVVAASVLGTLTAAPSLGSAATFPAGRADPCSDAATWTQRVSRPAGSASLEGLASAERACAATFTHLGDACPHALKAGDAYESLAARLDSAEAPKIAATVDFALAFEAYTFAAGACRGSALAVATQGAATAARHVKATR